MVRLSVDKRTVLLKVSQQPTLRALVSRLFLNRLFRQLGLCLMLT